jgi:hypothetical protein
MDLGNERGIKTPIWSANELFRSDDAEFISISQYQNTTDMLAMLVEQDKATGSTKDLVVSGLVFEWSVTLTSYLRVGAAVSYSGYYIDSNDDWGFAASAGDVFSVVVSKDEAVAVDAGGASARYDTIEIRPVRTDYDPKLRKFKDPITGTITSASVNTKREYDFEVQILKGTEGAGVAPNSTAGWIKVAEVFVDASASSIDQDDIKDVRNSTTWTAEADSTLYAKKLNNLSLSRATRAVASANLTVLDNDGYGNIDVTTGASDRTITLPTASANTSRRLRITKVDSGTGAVIVDGEGTETIDGELTVSLLAQYDSITIHCDGSEWFIESQVEENPNKVVSSANYTVTDVDGFEHIDVSTGASDRTITLPTAADNAGRRLRVAKTDSGAGAVIVDGESAELINGFATINMRSQYDHINIRCNGTKWFVEGLERVGGTKVVSSTNYTVLDNDGYDFIDVTTGASTRTITLPTVADNKGRILKITKVDSGAGAVTVDGEGGEVINSYGDWDITEQWGYLVIRCDGLKWIVESQWGSIFEVTDTGGDSLTTSWVSYYSIALGTPGTYKVTYAVTFICATTNPTITGTIADAGAQEDDAKYSVVLTVNDPVDGMTLTKTFIRTFATAVTLHCNCKTVGGTAQLNNDQVTGYILAERVA